jgi:Na+-driven multidrug efflux pump
MGNSKVVLVGSLIFLGVLIPLIIILGDIFILEGVALAMVLGYTSQAIYLIFIDKILKNKTKKL